MVLLILEGFRVIFVNTFILFCSEGLKLFRTSKTARSNPTHNMFEIKRGYRAQFYIAALRIVEEWSTDQTILPQITHRDEEIHRERERGDEPPRSHHREEETNYYYYYFIKTITTITTKHTHSHILIFLQTTNMDIYIFNNNNKVQHQPTLLSKNINILSRNQILPITRNNTHTQTHTWEG